MGNKKLFKRIVQVNNIPHKIFNQMQTWKLIWSYLFICISTVYILNWIGSLLIKDLNLPFYVSGVVLAFVITGVMGIKINLSRRFPDKYDYLDKLLSQYRPNNQETFNHLKKATAENPDKFPIYLEEWIPVEKETYNEYKAKPKHYQFTNSKK
ncbi:TPA: hypothetical protein ACRR2I_003976 [Providencia rettgeri]